MIDRIPTSNEDPLAIRVLVVYEHRSLLWGLRQLIDGEAPHMCVVHEATCFQEALNGLKHNPDIILLDLDLSGENAIDIVAELRERSHAKIIMLAGTRDVSVCDDAIMQGASGLVHKSEAAEVILKAISHVQAGELWFDHSTTARVFASLLKSRRSARRTGVSRAALLTEKERRIVSAVVKHRAAPAKVIANAMQISGNTLRNHLASIYGKLRVHRRIELVLYAMDAGLDKQDDVTDCPTNGARAYSSILPALRTGQIEACEQRTILQRALKR